MDILKGQRLPLDKLLPNSNFQIDLKISGIKEAVDFTCFGLDTEQKLSNDAYMTFFNQPKTPCGAIELSKSSNDSANFSCNLDKLPPTIDRLIFTACIDGSQIMQQIETGYFKFLSSGQDAGLYSFSGADFQNEKALMLGELYRKDGSWRFCAIGQGFNGGLDALVKHFGGDVSESNEIPPPVPPPKISLSKVTLEKTGDKISLEKPVNSKGHGRIVCNLNWTSNNKNKGFFGGSSKGIDLDLGCLFELSNGSKSVVQALGNCFGSYESMPYINLAADDRSGKSKDGEFMYINGNHLNDIKRICVFAFIYQGAFNWTEANAIVTVTIPDQPIIEVCLDGNKNNLNMCAIAMIENNNGQLKLTKLGEYFKGHKELDKHYKWGMTWRTGSK